MPLTHRMLLGVLTVTAIALPGRAADFNWRERLAPGKTLEIKGVNGAIRAERSTSAEAEVSAVKTGRHSDPNSVQVEVVRHEDGVTICAVYPSSNGRANECLQGSGGRMNVSNNDVKVEFTVRVPAGVHFTGRTVNGEIEAASLGGDAEAHTVNGKIRLSTTGRAQAHTVNGSITARMGAPEGSGALNFHTVNGGVTLELPAGSNAQVEVATVNGHITTDFPLMISGRFSDRRVTGSIGQGGPTISVKTVNGSIELRRQ